MNKIQPNNCRKQKMLLEETHEENNKLCLKYTCPKCKKTIFSLESKRPKTITLNLTVAQYESLMSSVGNVLQIMHESKRNNNDKQKDNLPRVRKRQN